MKYKTKASRASVQSLGLLALRIIETVIRSLITSARESKQFLILEEVNIRYQAAIDPGNLRQQAIALKARFAQRRELFEQIYDYLEGLLNSPDPLMKAPATLLFDQINMFGRSFSKLRIAEQSLRYIRIIGSLKSVEFTPAFTKTMLTEKFAAFEQSQLDYENQYMGLGNDETGKVAPSTMRKETEDAIKSYVDELYWIINNLDTEEGYTLFQNVQRRFDEITVTPAARVKPV